VKAILVSAWSNQHFIFSCFNDPKPLDFVLPGEAAEGLIEGADIIPVDLIFARVKQTCAPYLLLMSYIRSLTEAPIFLPSAPPPVDDVLAIPGGTSDPRLDEKVRKLGVAPETLRRKFWRVCETIFREACEQQHIVFVPAPLGTSDQNGFRRREYWGTDWLHGNPEYGELVLRQLDDLVAAGKAFEDGRSFVADNIATSADRDHIAIGENPSAQIHAGAVLAEGETGHAAENLDQTDRSSLFDGSDRSLSKLAAYSGDPWEPSNAYFAQAEDKMAGLWEHHVYPFINGCNFSCTLDLAAGHGRNSEFLLRYTSKLIVMDIQPGNVDICRSRFHGRGGDISYWVNNGYDLQPVADASVTMIYCFDAMVHFDSDVVRSYLRDSVRVLQPGARAFFHHSNYTGGHDWRTNPGSRAFMSRELFAHYALKEGLVILDQRLIDWGQPDLDCFSLVGKPPLKEPT
jgi:SAM-dependent methyltransferase